MRTDDQLPSEDTKCDFCFVLTSLDNDDQCCEHRLKKLKILEGVVDEMMQLISQN